MGVCTTTARPVATAKPTIAATQARLSLDHEERLAKSAADGLATAESPGGGSSGAGQWSIAPRLRKRQILSGCICVPSGERHRGAADEAVRDQGEHSLDLWLAYWRPRPGARVTVRRRPRCAELSAPEE